MTDPPALPSSLGIEAVQWSGHGEEQLTVRITGRWWRRRPTWGGQPVLMIETDGERHRFAAMPEPPSLSGTPPGMWGFSFSVPAALAPQPDSRVLLQLGGVVVPLPVSDPGGTSPFASADPATLSERRLRSAELALEAARKRATDAESDAARLTARIEELEHELAAARREPERLRADLSERDHARRRAEQRAHAERLLREDLQEELMRRAEQRGEAEALGAELEEAGVRIEELEDQIDRLRRRVDEAEHAAAAARVKREQAEREVERLSEAAVAEPGAGEAASIAPTEPAPPAPGPDEPGAGRGPARPRVIVAEGLLAARIAAPGRDPRTVARPRSPGAGPVDSAAIALEREMVARRRAPAPVADAPAGHEPAATSQLAALRAEFDELRSLIARERDRRRHAEARVAELEEQLSDQQRRAHRAYDVLDALREQLGEVRVAAARAGVAAAPEPPEPPAPEPPRVPETPPAPAASAAAPAERVEPERLAAALSRLRQAADDVAEQAHAAPGDDGPATAVPAPEAPPVRPWLEPVFRALTDRDPAAAGRLAVALLSAQGLVHPDPIAYDVILEETGCLAVSVADGKARVTLIPRPRPAEDVAFQIHGDLARFAKLLVAGRPRWYRRGLAKVTGARAAVETPARLLRRPLTLAQLSEAGVRLTPGMALTLAALMIPPRATGGERFTIAHREPSAATGGAHLHVRDGAVPAVTEGAALEPAEVTIVSPGDELLAVLAGDPAATAEVTGDERALALLREWLNRAQSG